MKRFTLSKSLFLSAAVASATACAGQEAIDDGSDCQSDTCDEKTPLKVACSSELADKSGRGFLPSSLKDDPLIKLVYSDDADGCPIKAEDIIKLLDSKQTDCDMSARAISEQAQLSNSTDGSAYRIVASRQCGSGPQFGMMFSMFGFGDAASAGMRVSGNKLPSSGIEIITFDKSDGVFNYYKEVGGKMGFFGNSIDFVTEGPGGPNLTSTRGCGNCHTGGGLIMKELQAPWLHWEGSTNTTGVAELLNNRSEFLGRVSNGIELEQIVRSGNDEWNQTRVKFMKAKGTVADLLRPLFCPVELNVREGSQTQVPNSLLADETLGFPSVGLANSGDYDDVLEAIGAVVPGTDSADTFFPFAHIERSAADQSYIQELVNARIIDDQFVQDVLAVDFTRPVFSNDRCDLLEDAPKLAAADRTSKKMRDAWIKSLKGAPAGSPAGVLLANLQATAKGQSIDHQAAIDAFSNACGERSNAAKISVGGKKVNPFLLDVFKLRSLQRKLAYTDDGEIDETRGSAQHPFKLFEFEDSLPTDDITPSRSAKPTDAKAVHIDARLDPNTCELVNKFVAPKLPDASGN